MITRTKKLLLALCLTLGTATTAHAQQTAWEKLSPWLRQLARQEASNTRQEASNTRLEASNTRLEAPNARLEASNDCLEALDVRKTQSLTNTGGRPSAEVCAFVRVTEDAEAVMQQYQSQSLTHVGNIHIARIPIRQLGALSADRRVSRIEARPMGQVLCDSMALHLNALPAYEGRQLPQAFTGNGIVVGVMDIGFDLTHPNFYDASGQHYRIRRLWDMLSTDTLGSTLYVGRDYTTTEQLLSLQHSRDGLDMTHGTHTLGIAAGSGYDSPYRGMAPESELCLVANAVSDNKSFIPAELWPRFTFATDALGFKYIFDYAKSEGKPCVISFSEGSRQDFWGYDQLFYEMLDSLVGPGRILVSAAGNQGHLKSWFRKEPADGPKGTFLTASGENVMCTLKADDDFTLRIVSYTEPADTLCLPASEVFALPDSLLRYGRLGGIDSLEIQAYPSCYDAGENCFDLIFYAHQPGVSKPLSIEIADSKGSVEFWRVNGSLTTNKLNPALCHGEYSHNILSPASAPSVICVGATVYRNGVTNYKGVWKSTEARILGLRSDYSSAGPTMDGRIKPDVMAPGINVISSYSSFYLENHPTASDIDWDVSHFDFNGRTYPWNCNSGTSMSCPAVAGAIALWLQAKPDLTPDEALEVIAQTSRHNDPALSYPNNEYGYGEIDVYRGLLYLLGIDGIETLSKTHTPAAISVAGGLLHIGLPPASNRQATSLRIYNMGGQQVLSTQLPAHSQEHTIDIRSLSPGIYAIQIEGEAKGSTLVRVGER